MPIAAVQISSSGTPWRYRCLAQSASLTGSCSCLILRPLPFPTFLKPPKVILSVFWLPCEGHVCCTSCIVMSTLHRLPAHNNPWQNRRQTLLRRLHSSLEPMRTSIAHVTPARTSTPRDGHVPIRAVHSDTVDTDFPYLLADPLLWLHGLPASGYPSRHTDSLLDVYQCSDGPFPTLCALLFPPRHLPTPLCTPVPPPLLRTLLLPWTVWIAH
jgi:hypothetical protein